MDLLILVHHIDQEYSCNKLNDRGPDPFLPTCFFVMFSTKSKLVNILLRCLFLLDLGSRSAVVVVLPNIGDIIANSM